MALLFVGLGGYGIWWFLQPSAHAVSERLIRDFAQITGREVSAFRRELRGVRPPAKDDGEATVAALAAIDARAEKAAAAVRAHTEAVRDKLAELNIPLGTQRNRLKRLEAKEEEAKDMIARAAEEARARLRDKK